MISLVENCWEDGREDFLPMQPGDVPETYADVDDWCAIRAFAQHATQRGDRPIHRVVSGYYR